MFLQVPFQGSHLTSTQKAYKAMSRSQVTVEWAFKEVKLFRSTVDFKRKMRIKDNPVGLLHIAAMLLTNFRNCVYPNTTSQYFKCAPPSPEEYVRHKDVAEEESLMKYDSKSAAGLRVRNQSTNASFNAYLVQTHFAIPSCSAMCLSGRNPGSNGPATTPTTATTNESCRRGTALRSVRFSLSL